MKAWLRKLWRDDSGQGTLEYILIIGLVVIAIFVIVLLFKDEIVRIAQEIKDWLAGQKVES